MSEPTCVIPINMSLGRACVALCARRDALGVDQRAKFNWVMLTAGASATPDAMAAAYWRAVAEDGPDPALPQLTAAVDRHQAARVHEAADAVRRALNRRRVKR